MTKIAIILLGIFGVLFGAAMILPALARHNHLGVWHDDMVWPIVAGGIIALAGTSIAAFGFKKRKV